MNRSRCDNALAKGGSQMTGYRMLIFALVLMAAAGCSTVEVSQDYAPDAVFSGIGTYAWVSGAQKKTGDLRVDSPLMDRRIRAAVTRRLGEMGLQTVAPADADIRVSYQFRIRQRIHSTGTRGGVGVGYGAGGGVGGVMLGTGADVRSYDEGMLVIDFLRPADETLIWRGNATFVMPEHQSPEAATALIEAAVNKTLAQFPPGKSQ